MVNVELSYLFTGGMVPYRENLQRLSHWVWCGVCALRPDMSSSFKQYLPCHSFFPPHQKPSTPTNCQTCRKWFCDSCSCRRGFLGGQSTFRALEGPVMSGIGLWVMTHALFGGMIGEKLGNLYLVGGLEHIGNNNSHLTFIFFRRGRYTTNQVLKACPLSELTHLLGQSWSGNVGSFIILKPRITSGIT